MSLSVDTRFPGGNVADVEILEQPDQVEVRFAADPRGGPESLWFHFRLVESEPRPERQTRVRLVWKYFESVLGGSDLAAVRPVFQPVGHTWLRLKQCEEIRLPDGRRELAWQMPYPAPATDVAFCFPYGAADLQGLIQRHSDYWRSDAIGISQGGRRLERLSNGMGEPGGRQPGIYLVARQHAGETPGSWVLDGFLQHLAKSRKGGYVVWAVPFADIDGVAEGAYGKDRYPYDLNRAWSLPAMRHEVHLIQQDMRRWASRCRPILALDLHAPGGCEHAGVYAFAGDEAEGPAAVEETKWCNVLQNELQAEFAAAEFRKTAAYASRWATPRFRDFAGKELGLPALTLETPYALVNNAVLTQKSYREIGRRLALGIFRRNG